MSPNPNIYSHACLAASRRRRGPPCSPSLPLFSLPPSLFTPSPLSLHRAEHTPRPRRARASSRARAPSRPALATQQPRQESPRPSPTTRCRPSSKPAPCARIQLRRAHTALHRPTPRPGSVRSRPSSPKPQPNRLHPTPHDRSSSPISWSFNADRFFSPLLPSN
jgi:hypothetical protein